jgi:hypothetical protein
MEKYFEYLLRLVAGMTRRKRRALDEEEESFTIDDEGESSLEGDRVTDNDIMSWLLVAGHFGTWMPKVIEMILSSRRSLAQSVALGFGPRFNLV